MKAKPLIVAMLGIVLIFVGMGHYTNSNIGASIEKSYKEFDEVTNVLSPLFDTYALAILSNQVKVAHDKMDMEDFCKLIKKNTDKQKEYLKIYADLIKGKETRDDKILFDVSEKVFLYTEKLSDLCKSHNKERIHELIYNGELFVLTDTATETINRILDTKFKNTLKYKSEARASIKEYTQVLTLAGSLSIILGVLAFKTKDECRSFKSKKKPRKTKK